jgi:hypothetical protein
MDWRRAALAIGMLLICTLAVTADASSVGRLDRNLSSLISDFNHAADSVRLVFVVGPTCPVCRRGLTEMKEDVLPRVPDNSNLSIFVVHVPALEATAEDVESTFSLFNDRRAHQYWDEMGTSGIRFQRSLGLPTYAWDVWMIYPPGVRWEDKDPPTPARWWHQLKGVSPEHRLNAGELSNTLNAMLLDSADSNTGGSECWSQRSRPGLRLVAGWQARSRPQHVVWCRWYCSGWVFPAPGLQISPRYLPTMNISLGFQ